MSKIKRHLENPECPYCGEQYWDIFERNNFKADGDIETVECVCGKEYDVQLHIETTFTCSAKENKV